MRVRHSKILWLLPAFVFAAVLCSAHPAEAKGHAKQAQSHTTTGDEAYYVTMNPMVLPVINDNGVQEVVSMIVALEVKDERSVESVTNMVPKLNDAYMRALYGKIDSSVFRNGQFLDVGKLKSKLVTVTDSVLGKGKVNDVLIQGVNQRHFD